MSKFITNAKQECISKRLERKNKGRAKAKMQAVRSTNEELYSTIVRGAFTGFPY